MKKDLKFGPKTVLKNPWAIIAFPICQRYNINIISLNSSKFIKSPVLSINQFRNKQELDVFVKHGCPRRQKSQNMAKISKSYILTPPPPQGACDVS